MFQPQAHCLPLVSNRPPPLFFVGVGGCAASPTLFTQSLPQGSSSTASAADADKTGPMMWVGVALLFVSLCFDGATGAYEDELMQNGHLGEIDPLK